MFTVTRATETRLEITMSGKLDAAEMSKALDELMAKSETIEGGEMLFRMGEFALPTFEAIKVELARFPSMRGFIGKFRRCALLADQAWLRTIAQFEGAFIPGVEIKGFGRDEEAAALAWLAEA